MTVTCGPRSVQTAKRCPALPVIRPGDVDKVEEVPPRGENTPCKGIYKLKNNTYSGHLKGENTQYKENK